jgi:hypothetical protein
VSGKPGGATLRGAVRVWTPDASLRRDAYGSDGALPVFASQLSALSSQLFQRWGDAPRSFWSAVAKPAKLPLFVSAADASSHSNPHPPQSARGLEGWRTPNASRLASHLPVPFLFSCFPDSSLPLGRSRSGCPFDADHQMPRSFAPLGSAGTAQRSIPTVPCPSALSFPLPPPQAKIAGRPESGRTQTAPRPGPPPPARSSSSAVCESSPRCCL